MRNKKQQHPVQAHPHPCGTTRLQARVASVAQSIRFAKPHLRPLEREGVKAKPVHLLFVTLFSTPVVAQTPAAPAGPSLGPLLMMFFLVLVLIPVALWFLKRIQPGTHSTSAGLKVVGQLVLGPRERVVVVEAGERWLLLGVTASSIQRVGTLPKGAPGQGEMPVVQTPAFLSVLQKFKS